MTNERRTEMDELRELRELERKQQAETERFFESTLSGETVTLTADELKARNRRNLWIALTISAFVLLVFFISMAKVESGIVAGGS